VSLDLTAHNFISTNSIITIVMLLDLNVRLLASQFRLSSVFCNESMACYVQELIYWLGLLCTSSTPWTHFIILLRVRCLHRSSSTMPLSYTLLCCTQLGFNNWNYSECGEDAVKSQNS